MNSSTDSPSGDQIKIGYVRRAHGIKGAAIVRVLDDEVAQFVPGAQIETDNSRVPILTVETANPHKDGLLVRFAEIPDRNTAEDLRGTSFFVAPDERRALDEDEFWPEDLIGLSVVDPDGTALGRVADVLAGSAQDRLVVETANGTFDVPFVSEIVTAIDPSEGLVTVDAPSGLFEL